MSALDHSLMSQQEDNTGPGTNEYVGIYADGVIRLSASANWPDGTPVLVRVNSDVPEDREDNFGKVIIAGFGLAGRWVADIFDRHGIDYVIVEQNHDTIESQRRLGREAVEGNIGTQETLCAAGIESASILALTIPDEQAVLEATRRARELNPDIYIVARTTHYSAGMQATQLGADEVIKGEQVVARQFYEMLSRKLGKKKVLASSTP